MEFPGDRPLLRIGELSRHLGVSDHVLRAWESRHGLLQPVRSPGGFRLYSGADESRIRRMQAYLADGAARGRGGTTPRSAAMRVPPLAISPGRASPSPQGVSPPPGSGRHLDAFDEPAAQAVLDRLLADLPLAGRPAGCRASLSR